MSIKMTKEHLAKALTEAENKVIALSGRWGTGKSHLWSEIQNASTDESVKSAIYVSLFGLASMDQVKLKVVQSAIPIASENPRLFEGVRKTISTTIKALEGLHKSFSALGALGEFAMLLTPAILKGKVIVLDDIERKHSMLSVDEILGFIDEFTQRHQARFVLILNTDLLKDKLLWEILREKVLDVELKLETSPEEAFEIAIELTPSRHAASIKSSVVECGLTNIRIIRKVIRSVNNILGVHVGLSDAMLARVVPSTVLLSAIHYRGIEDAPPMEFVLSAGSAKNWVRNLNMPEQEDDGSEEVRREGRWKGLLNRLGILGCDEFEVLIADYLESGLFEVDSISQIIDRYAKEEQSMVAREMGNKFIHDSIWNHRLTETQLLDQASALLPSAPLLDPYNLTNICESIAELSGGGLIADAMIAAWIESFKAKEMNIGDDDFPLHRKVHPLIQAEFDAKKAHSQAQISVYSVCEHVAKHNGWGTRHKLVMAAASPAEFEMIIRTLDVPEFKIFFHQMMDFLTKKSVYGVEFGVGADRFAEACRNIVNSQDAGRLGKLIKSIFEDANVPNLLGQSSDRPSSI